MSDYRSSGFVISWTALTIDDGYGGLAGGRQLVILGGRGGGKSNSEWEGWYNFSADAFLLWEECLEWDEMAELVVIIGKLVELADNVEVVAFVTLDAVLEWLILRVAVLEVVGLTFKGNEPTIGEDSWVSDASDTSVGSSNGSGSSDSSSIVEYTSE